MKKIHVMIIAATAACAFAACSGNKSSSSSSDSAVSTTSVTSTTDSITRSANPDSTFANKAAIGGMAEVDLGKLALSKTTSTKLKDFANMMVTDHGKANNELMDIAKTKKLMLPATVDGMHQMKIDSLSKLSGIDFDRAYATAMVDGHQKTLNLMKDEAANGKDPELKAFAAKIVPTVQMHLDAINKICAAMK